jgi:hypothetical protein
MNNCRTSSIFGHRLRAARPALAAAGLLLPAVLLFASGCERRSEPGSAAEAPTGRAMPAATAASDEIAASHILVAWTGVRDCPEGLQRTQAEAEERARRLALLLRTGRGEMDDLARRYSDDPTAQRNGGYLGVFKRGEMQAALESLVASLKVGEIGGPVVTPYGWHVVRREPVLKLRLHHLLIAHRDARQVEPDVKRDRTEAERIAQALYQRLNGPGADRCVLAASFSDDPSNRGTCGDLGWIEPGVLEPAAERAVFGLAPGEISPVIESVYGFHIFWRPSRP